MWIADNWKDYEVLDTSNGEKLERWGDYILVRPDPQVIWNTPHEHKGWKKKNGHYHRSTKGGGEWEFFNLPNEWSIGYELGGTKGVKENQLTFHLKPFSFKHTGLFPEQAANWVWMQELIRNSGRSDVKVLNLFGYTGAATIACAAAGAHVTHVDASKGIVQWAKENRELSGLPENRFRFIVEDALRFVQREIRRGNKYDGILMDPPSYGRGPSGEVWKLENELFGLIDTCAQVLSDQPLFYLINSYTTGFQASVLSNMLEKCVVSRHGGKIDSQELCLPVTSGGVLPAGASGRWSHD